MNNCKLVMALICLAIIFCGCGNIAMDYTDNKIRIDNHSDQDIIVLVNYLYPDDSVKNAFYNGYTDAHSKGSIAAVNTTWEEIIIRSKKITLFFMPKSYPEEFGEQKAKRYVSEKDKITLSIEDLEKMDWIVIYPLKK